MQVIEYFSLEHLINYPWRFLLLWVFWYVLTCISYLSLGFRFYNNYTKDKVGDSIMLKGFKHVFTDENLREDIYQSLVSFLLVSLCPTIAAPLLFAGHGQLYTNWNEYGGIYFILNPFVLLIFHDLFHYWMHRMSHQWNFFYKNFHYRHHQVKHPTAFSGWAMHPVDAFANSIFVFIVPFIIPSHPVAIFINMNVAFYLSFTGHSVESNKFVSDIAVLCDPKMHVLHHKRQDVNYGFLTRIWDYLFKTELR